MIVYILFHSNVDETGIRDRKLIGIFSSYNIAKATIKKYSKVSGFIDFPNGFRIKPYYVNGKISTQNNQVFFLQYVFSEEEIDHVTDLGLYFSRVQAIFEAIGFGLSLLVKRQQGQIKLGGRFYNVAYRINEEYWKEGFFTYKDMT